MNIMTTKNALYVIEESTLLSHLHSLTLLPLPTHPLYPITKSPTHHAWFKYAGVNIEQFIREAFSRQNDLSGVFFSSFSFSLSLLTTVAVHNGPDFFPPILSWIKITLLGVGSLGLHTEQWNYQRSAYNKVNGCLCFELTTFSKREYK